LVIASKTTSTTPTSTVLVIKGTASAAVISPLVFANDV
jgi:hypothetical protein